MNNILTVSRYHARTLQPTQPVKAEASNMRKMQQDGFAINQKSSQLHMMVRAAMASGKTRFVKYVMAAHLYNDETLRCLSVVPACNIGDGYAEENVLSYPTKYNIPDLDWKINSKEHFTDNKTKVFEKFLNWLQKPQLLEIERRAVISHVTFARLIEDGYGNLLNNIIINIDEAHHSAHDGNNGNNLGKAVNYLLNNAYVQGISLILTTATPSRADSFKLVGDKHQDDFVEYEYNFAQYLEDARYIKGYDYKILPSEDNWLDITKNNELIKRGDKVVVFMPGENRTKVTQRKAPDNVKDWITATADEGTNISFDKKTGICPITIRGVSYNVLNLVEQEYQKVGIKYVNNNPNAVDILLTVQLFAEGSDWTPANKAIIYGQRGSIVELIQSIGRIFRDHEKKVGKRSIVNIVHVIPGIDLENTPRESYNAMLKAINIALLFKSVNLPMDYVILNTGETEPRARFNYIEALREVIGNGSDSELSNVLGKMSEIIPAEYYEAVREHGQEVSNTEINTSAMKHIAEMLVSEYGADETVSSQIAEVFVLSLLWERRLAVMGNLSNIDVSEIDYNLISEYNVAELFMSGMKPQEFWEWYEKIYCAGEVAANEKTNEIIDFYKKHGRYPNHHSKNEDERVLGKKLGRFRTNKDGTSNHIRPFYQSCEDIAIARGHPDLFNYIDYEVVANKATNEIIDFHEKYGRYPVSSDNRDKKERRLSSKLGLLRMAKASKGTFYPSCEDIAIERGHPDLFNFTDYESLAIEKTNVIIDFYEVHGRYPVTNSKDKEESKLVGFIRHMRCGKRGEGNDVFYKSCEDIAIERGHPDLFNYIDREAIAIEATNTIIDFYEEHGRYPTTVHKDKEESKLGHKLRHFRNAKTNPKCGGIHYQSCEDIAIERGHSNLFNLIDNETIANETTNTIIDFYEKHGKYPSAGSNKDKEVSTMGGKLSKLRSAKKGKGEGLFYKSCQDIAIERGHPNMFNPWGKPIK